jgi:hypothetical protein
MSLSRSAAYTAKYGEEAAKTILRLIAQIAARSRWGYRR